MIENNIMQLMPNFVTKHWNYERNSIAPEEVSVFSEENYYWKNESYDAFYFKPSKVHSRLRSTSLPELTIYYYLSQLFENVKSRYVFNEGNKKYEADIYIPCIKLVI